MNCAIIAIVKYEEKYIVDWLDWHIKIGVNHFYLYDDNDEDYVPKLEPIIKNYIDDGIVTLLNKNDFEEFLDLRGPHKDNSPDHKKQVNKQMNVYTHFFNKYKHLHDYIGFFDIDEYIKIPNEKYIGPFLEKYEKYSIFYLWWHFYINENIYNKDSIFKQIKECKEYQFTNAERSKLRYRRNKYILNCKKFKNEKVLLDSPHIIPSKYIKKDALKIFNDKEAYLIHYKYKSLTDFIDKLLGKYYKGKKYEINDVIKEYSIINNVTDNMKKYLLENYNYKYE